MGDRANNSAGAGLMVVLLPTMVVVLFNLLRLRLHTPTAGGLSFLVAVLIAYWFFPGTRLSARKIIIAAVLAVLAAALMTVLLAHD